MPCILAASSAPSRAKKNARYLRPEALPGDDAVQAYESLRASVLEGRAHGPGAAALRYHGMLQGLAILLRTTPVTTVPIVTATGKVRPTDDAFVRLLANIVLRTHTELMHVY